MKIVTKIEIDYLTSAMQTHDQMVEREKEKAKMDLVGKLYDELEKGGLIEEEVVNNPRTGCHEITFTLKLDPHSQPNYKPRVVVKEKPVYRDGYPPLKINDVINHLSSLPKKEEVLY